MRFLVKTMVHGIDLEDKADATRKIITILREDLFRRLLDVVALKVEDYDADTIDYRSL